MNRTTELLKQLVSTPAVSSFEKELGMSALISSFFPSSFIDSIGNVIVRIGNGKRRILIEAHMDEVGFIKTTKGFAKVGLIADEEIQEKNIEYREEIMTPAYFKRTWKSEGTLVRSPALDNKTSCVALILLAEQLKNINAEVYLAFTAQEETTQQGLRTVMEQVKPEVVISVDSAYAQPFETDRWEIPICGNGASIQPQGDKFMILDAKWIAAIAEKKNIPYQWEIVDSKEGATNLTGILQTVQRLQINVPVRYQHTAQSETDIRDIESAANLLFAVIEELSKSAN